MHEESGMSIKRLSPNQPRGFELGSPYPFPSFLPSEIQLSKHSQSVLNIEPNNDEILRQAKRIQNVERVRNPKRKRPIEDVSQSSQKQQWVNGFVVPEQKGQGSTRRLSLKNSNLNRTPSPYGAPRKPPSARARRLLDAARKSKPTKPHPPHNSTLSSLTRNVKSPTILVTSQNQFLIQKGLLKQTPKRTSRLPSPKKMKFLPALAAKKTIPKRSLSQGSNPPETSMLGIEEVKEELCEPLQPTQKSLREDIKDYEQCVEKLCAGVEENMLLVEVAREALLDLREDVRDLCINIQNIDDSNELMKVRKKAMELKDDVAQIKKHGYDPGDPEFIYDKGILATKQAWEEIEDRLHIREALLHVDFTQYKEYYQFQRSKQFQNNVKAKVRRFLKDFEQHENEYKPGTEIRESHHLKSILGGEAKGQMGLYATKTFKAGDVIGAFRGKFYTLEESEFYHGEGMVGHKRSSYLMTVPFCKSDGRTNHFLCCDPFPKSGAVNDFRYNLHKTRNDPANDKKKQNMVWLLVTYNDIVFCMEVALKTIKSGEEILTHYSNDYSASEYFRQEKERIQSEKKIKEVTRVPMVDIICA